MTKCNRIVPFIFAFILLVVSAVVSIRYVFADMLAPNSAPSSSAISDTYTATSSAVVATSTNASVSTYQYRNKSASRNGYTYDNNDNNDDDNNQDGDDSGDESENNHSKDDNNRKSEMSAFKAIASSFSNVAPSAYQSAMRVLMSDTANTNTQDSRYGNQAYSSTTLRNSSSTRATIIVQRVADIQIPNATNTRHNSSRESVRDDSDAISLEEVQTYISQLNSSVQDIGRKSETFVKMQIDQAVRTDTPQMPLFQNSSSTVQYQNNYPDNSRRATSFTELQASSTRSYSAKDKTKQSFKDSEKLRDDMDQKVHEATSRMKRDIKKSIALGDDITLLPAVETAVRASLQDVEYTVKSAGVDISLDTVRPVLQEIAAQHETIMQSAREALYKRDGMDLYRDSDQDGVSDYDEHKIYNTNPYNAHTSGSKLTDGERILLGLDVNATANTIVPVQAPRDDDIVSTKLFQMTSMDVETEIPVVMATSSSNTFASSTAQSEAEREIITISGTALPNSFVTVYVYSTPIVMTVKADDDGKWTVKLDKQLEDGSHNAYVAMVDNAGRIIARSPAIPFTKKAEALSYTPLVAPVDDGIPLESLRYSLLMKELLLVVVAVGGVVLAMSVMRSRHKTIS